MTPLVTYKFFDFTFADGPTERVKIDHNTRPFISISRWAAREEVTTQLLSWVKRKWPNRELLRIDRPRTCERLYTRPTIVEEQQEKSI
jgi:hypothetical protein